ncbi:hypothetical protein L1987_14964 [Smallanthus sonchifolius]|uniref:Uncharacterized protein n=1 Tax=Smallanthus sonchifolius TaxID=185202 RepID=A0ACB9J599_9ASTR|nr:hypothetical protein L1987_14964 [Smallanthus sonchifolius]
MHATNSVHSDERVVLEPAVRDAIVEDVYHVICSTILEFMAVAIKAVVDGEKAKEKSSTRGLGGKGNGIVMVFDSDEEEEGDIGRNLGMGCNNGDFKKCSPP